MNILDWTIFVQEFECFTRFLTQINSFQCPGPIWKYIHDETIGSFVQDRSLNSVQLKNGVCWGKKACPRAANQLSFYVTGLLGLETETQTYSKYFYQFSCKLCVPNSYSLTLSTKLTFSQSGKIIKIDYSSKQDSLAPLDQHHNRSCGMYISHLLHHFA